MAKWLMVNPLGEIADLGLDTNERVQFGFNVLVTKVPSATFEDEVVTVLEAASVGIENANIFISSKAVIPTGAGPYLSIIASGGTPGLKTHNVLGVAYRQPSAQIVVRGATEPAAKAMAEAARAALLVVKNQNVAA